MTQAELRPIQGSPPQIGQYLGMCAFMPRCPYAMKICTQKVPQLKGKDGEHQCCCFKNLKTAVGDAEAMRDFESKSLPIGAEHSQQVKAAPIGSDFGSKDCVDSASPAAVLRFKKDVR